MEEIWKDIPGYEELYQASNLGNIRSIKNNKNAHIVEVCQGKLKTACGYKWSYVKE